MTVIALGAGYAETCKSGSGGGSAETAAETQYGAAVPTSHLMQLHSSYVVTDPKGTILIECGKLLQRGAPKLDKDGKPMKDKNGKTIYEPYRIKVLNTINFKKSMKYNPFAYIHSEKDILKLVTTLIANTKGEGKAGDDFWVSATRSHTNTIPQRIELCGR